MKKGRGALNFVLASLGSLAAAILPLGAWGPGDQGTVSRSTIQRAEGFTPRHDGFGFRNIFRGSPLPASVRDADSGPLRAIKLGLGSGLGLPSEFGLCGGMSIAAADYYLAKVPVPDQ